MSKITQTNKTLTQQVFHPGLFLKDKSIVAKELKFNQAANHSAVDENKPVETIEIDENSDDAALNLEHPPWQKVPQIRRYKRRRTNQTPSPPPHSNGNRYSPLNTDDPGDKSVQQLHKTRRENKPPPLILYGIEDVNKLVEAIDSTLSKNEYSIKIVTKTQTRVTCSSVEAYKKLMTLVRELGLIGHTFTPKTERSYRIVIKNLHHTTPYDAIREEIEKTGNTVKGEIINARVGPNKRPSTTFFVNLEPSVNNKEVKSIRYIFNTVVKIEDPIKRKTIVQCTKCQQYGHTKNNCLRPYRCVKCAEAHKTSDCPKTDRSTPAKCALCLGNHPANYKGCEVYKEILKRRETKNKQFTKQEKLVSIAENIQMNPEKPKKEVDDPLLLPKQPANQRSYAEALGGGTHTPSSNEPDETVQELRELIILQSKKMDKLMEQLGALVGLMTTLVTKMLK